MSDFKGISTTNLPQSSFILRISLFLETSKLYVLTRIRENGMINRMVVQLMPGAQRELLHVWYVVLILNVLLQRKPHKDESQSGRTKKVTQNVN